MKKEELYELLDIESPEDFQYFENMAELFECDEDIDFGDLCALVEGVDKEVFKGLVDEYFQETTEFIPGDAAELFILLDKVKLALMGMARACDEEELYVQLSEEINRFRRWYSAESVVTCVSIKDNREESCNLRDALVLARMEKLGGEKYIYDFSACLSYPVDEYAMSFGDIIAAGEEDEDNYGESGEADYQ